MSTERAISALRRKGETAFGEEAWEQALAYYAELVRLQPGDHLARFRAARCLLALGEQERAITAYHAAAEGLLRKGYLLSAMAAAKEALRINPVEKRVKDTLARIHAKAERQAHGRTPVPPPLPTPVLGSEVDVWEALTNLSGAELVEKAMEVLARPPDSSGATDPGLRPPLPLFADLDRDAFIEVVQKMSLVEYLKDEVIIEQGKPGDALYVICAGGARVVQTREDGSTVELARVPGGTLLGEMALLTEAPRTASVIADRPSEVFILHRRDLEEISKAFPKVPAQLVEFCRRRLLSNLVNTSPLFAPLDPQQRLEVLEKFRSKVYRAGEVLVEEGQPGTGLHVILTGEVQVTRRDPSGEPVVLATLREGDVLGEISLIRDVPATATVTALRRTATVVLSPEAFAHLIADHAVVREYLQGLSEDRLERSAAALAADAEELSDEDLVVL
ncbi:MAG: cyclic nucleotide-binding domain-containing protein [Deltaproteobacteria bacterium]|nr:MAG: cyclic nucleotide-binding domain-containing protein [Deltaproteobacteria bacterium]